MIRRHMSEQSRQLCRARRRASGSTTSPATGSRGQPRRRSSPTRTSSASPPTRRSSRRRIASGEALRPAGPRPRAARRVTVDEAVRALTTYDVRWACDVLRPVYDASDGVDGRVSIEVDPRLAHDTRHDHRRGQAAVVARRPPEPLHQDPGHQGRPAGHHRVPGRGDQRQRHPDLLARALPRGHGRLPAGLEQAEGHGPRPDARSRSVASFFVCRVDTEIDKRLDKIGTDEAKALRGKAAHRQRPAGLRRPTRRSSARERWKALGRAGAKPQRPLWASTGVKDPPYDDTLYVVELVAPGTVNTMPEATLEAVARPRRGPRRHRPPALRRRDSRSRRRPARGWASTTTTSSRCSRTRASRSSRTPGTSCSRRSRTSSERLAPEKTAADVNVGRARQPAARPARPPAPAHRRPVRPGHLRGHRRPVPQEAACRRSTTWPTAACCRPASPWSASPGATGRTRTSRRSCTSRSRSTRARRTARRSGSSSPRASASSAGDFDDDDAFDRLRADHPTSSTRTRGTGGNLAFYLSIPPKFFPDVVRAAQGARALPDEASEEGVPGGGWSIEKPFGHDLASAQELNRIVDEVFAAGGRSSGSTTTSARRPSRTSSRCASPTRCSSRSGTPTTSTTCRSRWPRTSASAGGRATTTASAPPATSSRTTCCSCSR